MYGYVKGDPINNTDSTGMLVDEAKLRELEHQQFQRINQINQEKTTAPISEVAGNVVKGLVSRIPFAAPVVAAASASPAGKNSAVTDGRIPLYRVYGGEAGQYGKNDSTTGTFYSLADPSQLSSKEAVRQDFALPPSWGNDLSKVATVYANPADVTHVGPAGEQKDLVSGATYQGGGIEVLIVNAREKVIPMGSRDSNLQ